MTKAKAKKPAAKLGGEKPKRVPRVSISKDVEKVLVKNEVGEVIRHYSAVDHGENFLELANEFASKVEGRVVVEA